MSVNTKEILVIDDDIVTRKIITKHLEKNGFEIIQTDKASDALKLLHDNNVDLVLCDIEMDDMDGYEFCNLVRSEEKYKALPFIFVSSRDSIEDKNKALNMGADDYITKPVDVDSLLLKVKSLLKRVEIYKQFSLRQKLEYNIDNEKYKVLILDDDPLLQTMIASTLERSGMEPIKASNAEDALNKVKTLKPDLILSDLMMPDVSGFEFRKMLLDDNYLKEIPFVFLTSIDEESAILEGYDMDIKDFISKAQNPKLIAIKVKNILDTISKERKKSIMELQQVASSVAIEVVPDKAKQIKGYAVNQLNIPYKGMPGGDFLDYIQVDDNRMVVIVGDVMGKQWGAWFFTFSFIGYLRSAIRVAINSLGNITAGGIMTNVNSAIYKDAKVSEIFSTVTCLIIDNLNNTVQYSGAGDLSVLLYKNNSGEIEQFESSGLLLGISEDGDYDNIVIPMEPKDELIVFTDGVVDSRNSEGKSFGMNNIIENLKSKSDDIYKFDLLKRNFIEYTGNNYDDDVTLVGIKRE
ncbi:MAG TPA: response regulator [Bacteroidetes bacterium]|nr:response regulator [Ignavibacteria bacterium]HCA42681.1 response regulator [Bacteroidota bacterium]HCN38042.1 response regulator [Bacteroidota bacterium]